LLIYSHADGRTMCPDEHSRTEMGIPELSAEIGRTESVDFLALELCNMGGIEIAYQWRPGTDRFGADVLLAIPNAGPPLDWDRAFARIRSPDHDSPAPRPPLDPAKMTAEDFGRLVVEEGHLGRMASQRGGERESAACYDLRTSEDVKRAVDAMSVALCRSDTKQAFMELRGPGPGKHAMNYTENGPYVDLYDLCKRAAACEHFPPEVRSAATAVMGAVDRFVIASFGMSAYEGFEPGKNGVFIVLPANETDRWKSFRWYTPLPGDAKNYGRWSFLADGATPGNGAVENWFELLDSWFDENDDKGGVNAYRP
jgi:clostripain